MAPSLTYFEFLAFFVLPPLVVLAAVTYRRPRLPGRFRVLGIGITAALALAYTTPWDNYLIMRGVWSYGDGAVAGTVWYAPIGEYLFILLQTVVASLWVYRIAPERAPSFTITRRGRLGGALAGLAVGAVGGWLLGSDPTFYVGAILAWGGPVLAIQWAFGWPYLLRVRRAFALGVLVPTVYFAAADRIAISIGIWELSSRYTTGITVAGLPVEEGAFFLLTNLFLAQGVLLFQWLYERGPIVDPDRSGVGTLRDR